MKYLLTCLIACICSLTFLFSADAEVIKVADFTLNDIDGNPLTISKLDGLIILDFWATWCPPCRVEIPYLQAFYDEFKEKGLSVVGISTENEEIQKKFVEDMKKQGVDITYHLLVDPEGVVTRKYQIQGIPTTIFIKPDLTQIEREVGFTDSYAPVFREIIINNLPGSK